MFILGLTFGKFHFWLNCCDSKKKNVHVIMQLDQMNLEGSSVYTSVCQRDHLIDEV